MKKNTFGAFSFIALFVLSIWAYAGDATTKLEQTLSDLEAFTDIAQNEEGQWLSYTHENGDILRQLLSTERVLKVYEASSYTEGDLEMMAEIAEGLKPFVKPYGQLVTTSEGAYQEEFIDMYEMVFYYTLLGAKALGDLDIETGDADMDEMFNMLKTMMKPISKMMAKGFKAIIDKEIFIGDARNSADAAYETMRAKSIELFGE